MSKPFDATLKELITHHPEDWLTQLGIPITATPEILNVDLSTVTAAADTLIKVGDLVVHIDVESGPDDDLGTRILLYNVLTHREVGVPVHSVVVLLRPKAAGRDLSDVVEYSSPGGNGGLRFQFQIIRAWELDAEEWLRAGIGLIALAVLGRPPAGLTRLQALPGLAERIVARGQREAPAEVGVIVAASFILSTMHVGAGAARTIFSRLFAMDEIPGVTYLQELGAIRHQRNLITRAARKKLGAPTETQVNKLNVIEDIDRLDRMVLKIASVKSWDGLLRVK